MISETINQKIAEALKAHDEIRLSTLRMLSSAFNYERIALQHDLSQEEEFTVVRREIKKRQDAIEAYEKAGRDDRAETEKKELEILKFFLPPEMSDQELDKIVTEAVREAGATSPGDIGKLMGLIMPKVKGKADGNKVLELVKSKLS